MSKGSCLLECEHLTGLRCTRTRGHAGPHSVLIPYEWETDKAGKVRKAGIVGQPSIVVAPSNGVSEKEKPEGRKVDR